MAVLPELQPLSDELTTLGTTGGRDEIRLLFIINAIFESRLVEVAAEIEKAGAFHPGVLGRRFDLNQGLKDLYKYRTRLIEDEIPDPDTWADGFYGARTIIRGIIQETTDTINWAAARGEPVEAAVLDSDIDALRRELRS